MTSLFARKLFVCSVCEYNEAIRCMRLCSGKTASVRIMLMKSLQQVYDDVLMKIYFNVIETSGFESMNYYLRLFVVVEIIIENCFIYCDLRSDIINYYNSETVRSFHKQWEIHRRSYENALKIVLKESFGKKAMNTIERKTENAFILSDGFYITDNVVHVVFKDLCLTELPHLKTPEVTFQLANNVLLVEAELGKMIVETKYNLMRNSSELIFTSSVQDPYKSSPFVLQQVMSKGNAAITVDGCSINGFAISILSGQTIVLGHDTFRVSNCKFNIEISSAGSGSPPVIAPYFSNEQRILLENLINKPLRMEMMSKLQSYMFTFINTSIFDKDLFEYKTKQEKIFKTTRNHIDQIIRNANKQTVIGNKASEDLPLLEILRNGNNQSKTKKELVMLSDMVVDGFDSAYSPHIGGPYKLKTVGIAETLRYNTLKVRGQLISVRDEVRRTRNFFMELQDVGVNLEMNLENESQGKFSTDTNIYWRNMDFSIINMSQVRDRVTAESIISGYLINEIPKCLTQRLIKLTESDVIVPPAESINKEMVTDSAFNGSDHLVKKEGGVESISQGDKNSEINVNLKETGSFEVMLKPVQDVQVSDDEQNTKVQNKIVVQSLTSRVQNLEKELNSSFGKHFVLQTDTEDADVYTRSEEEGGRRHRKKNIKRNRNGKHRNHQRHRVNIGKNKSNNKKVVNRKRLKHKFTQMPIYMSENEV